MLRDCTAVLGELYILITIYSSLGIQLRPRAARLCSMHHRVVSPLILVINSDKRAGQSTALSLAPFLSLSHSEDGFNMHASTMVRSQPPDKVTKRIPALKSPFNFYYHHQNATLTQQHTLTPQSSHLHTCTPAGTYTLTHRAGAVPFHSL